MSEPIWETHPQTAEELAERVARIETEHRSAIVHHPLTEWWWAFRKGERLGITYRSKWDALRAIREGTTTGPAKEVELSQPPSEPGRWRCENPNCPAVLPEWRPVCPECGYEQLPF